MSGRSYGHIGKIAIFRRIIFVKIYAAFGLAKYKSAYFKVWALCTTPQGITTLTCAGLTNRGKYSRIAALPDASGVSSFHN